MSKLYRNFICCVCGFVIHKSSPWRVTYKDQDGVWKETQHCCSDCLKEVEILVDSVKFNGRRAVNARLKGVVVHQFNSLTDAANFVLGDKRVIHRRCRGMGTTYKGYEWRYETELSTEPAKKRRKKDVE